MPENKDKNEPTENTAQEALLKMRDKLLDLTAKNPLLNLSHTKTSLRVVDELPNQLAETLLNEKEMRFLPVPESTEEEWMEKGCGKKPTAEEWAKHLGQTADYEVPELSPEEWHQRHTDNEIQTLFYPAELEKRFKTLFQKANLAIEEMGTNILYLALGFLEWYESDDSKVPRLAPLFLLPLQLAKGSLDANTSTYRYTIRYSGEDIMPNLSLREKLLSDFNMKLPELDENKTPEAYFEEVRKVIEKNKLRWKVRRYVTVALLNFNKLLMYLDMDPEKSNILDHPLAKQFLGEAGEEQEKNQPVAGADFSKEHPIDETVNIHGNYPLIDNADSSQHSALIDAIDGKNLVIEGPPGTGKSQTITNLIAAALSNGKKVLFVAEKLAALEVVQRRLEQAGLGEFCLELHSHKSQKQKVLGEIEKRLNTHYRSTYLPTTDIVDIEAEIQHYEELKEKLKSHAERINQPWKQTKKTPHEIFAAAARYRKAINPILLEKLHPEGCNGDNYDLSAQLRYKGQVRAFRKVWEGVAAQLDEGIHLQSHPWYGVCNVNLLHIDMDKVKSLLETWRQSLQNLREQRTAIIRMLGCKSEGFAETLKGISNLLVDWKNLLERLPPIQDNELLECLPKLRGETLQRARRFRQLSSDLQERHASLAQKGTQAILQDLSVVDNLLDGSKQLKQWVGKTVTLYDLSKAIEDLKTIQDQLNQLKEPWQGFAESFGNTNRAKYFPDNKAGLVEFKTIIEIIASLDPVCWKYTDPCFDNEELDALFPKLRKELEEMWLQKTPQEVLPPENLPDDTNELQKMLSTLDNDGVFRFFSPSFWMARKQLLRCAPNLPAWESLRNWYRKVREEYGFGFGSRVALGEAILNLPVNIFQAVRSLSHKKAPQQLVNLLGKLKGLSKVFSPVIEWKDDNALLIGKDSIVSRTLAQVQQAIENCGINEAITQVTDNDTTTVADMIDLIEKLGLLKRKVEEWKKEYTQLNKEVFQDRLDLSIGPDANNSERLTALANILEVADCLNKMDAKHILIRYIYEQPSAKTFQSLKTGAAQLRKSLDTQENSFDAFKERTQLDENKWNQWQGDSIHNLIKRNQRALGNVASLQSWLAYLRERKGTNEAGLGKLVDCVEQGDIKVSQVESAYQAGIFDLLSREIFREDLELARFSGLSQKARQDEFKKCDDDLKQLQRKRIARRIREQAEVPEGNRSGKIGTWTELALLERECEKTTRHIPIRQLIRRAGKALIALKPCFMMGPMSVAQYLKPGKFQFDMVVMDEASQIKPEDALGAIARGKQLVVVGDTKQLPPTAFFQKLAGDEEEDEETVIEGSESILETTLSIFPTRPRRLRWHYRSRHESLIAFSNHSFYDGNLVIFPSPNKETEEFGIRYQRVKDGCFVSQQNKEEANMIVQAVREHFQKRPDETLGVAAMSAKQRDQIENEIEVLAKKDGLFATRLGKDAKKQESLFIKNLENVQGDERDVIFISMTYGPQQPGGKVPQRFGPINSEHGWRRLNVLFTRSKKRMHVFSSMDSGDILVGSNAKRGVCALQDFLKYCETGNLSQKDNKVGSREPDSDFEIAVMEALQREGFECDAQVGVEGYFIDVAVKDSGKPGRYLMGIECDGAMYHSAKSVRDRDRLRQQILESLGWKIRRIWSTDWFHDPNAEIKRIVNELNKLKTDATTPDNDD